MLTSTALRQSEDHKYTDTKDFGPFVTKTFSHHIPGYLGFQPREASNSKGQVLADCWLLITYNVLLTAYYLSRITYQVLRIRSSPAA